MLCLTHENPDRLRCPSNACTPYVSDERPRDDRGPSRPCSRVGGRFPEPARPRTFPCWRNARLPNDLADVLASVKDVPKERQDSGQGSESTRRQLVFTLSHFPDHQEVRAMERAALRWLRTLNQKMIGENGWVTITQAREGLETTARAMPEGRLILRIRRMSPSPPCTGISSAQTAPLVFPPCLQIVLLSTPRKVGDAGRSGIKRNGIFRRSGELAPRRPRTAGRELKRRRPLCEQSASSLASGRVDRPGNDKHTAYLPSTIAGRKSTRPH